MQTRSNHGDDHLGPVDLEFSDPSFVGANGLQVACGRNFSTVEPHCFEMQFGSFSRHPLRFEDGFTLRRAARQVGKEHGPLPGAFRHEYRDVVIFHCLTDAPASAPKAILAPGRRAVKQHPGQSYRLSGARAPQFEQRRVSWNEWPACRRCVRLLRPNPSLWTAHRGRRGNVVRCPLCGSNRFEMNKGPEICSLAPCETGSPGRIRTSDQPVNSRLLYR
jgi:hypothetical protein